MDNNSYYRAKNGIQLVDIIAAADMSFCRGNALKYLVRAGKKEGESFIKDITKAVDYIDYTVRLSPAKAADTYITSFMDGFGLRDAHPAVLVAIEYVLHYWGDKAQQSIASEGLHTLVDDAT